MSRPSATARSVSADPVDAAAPAHLALARALETAGRGAEAAQAYEAALQSEVSSLQAQLGLARTLIGLGRIEEAFLEADAALRLDSGSADAWALIAEALAALGESGYAAQAYARAAEFAPRAADRHVRCGQLWEAAGQPFEAAAAFNRALTLKPSPEAHASLSGLHGKAGQFGIARQHAEAALSLDPDHQGAQQNLAAICDHEGLMGDAEAHRERAYRGRALLVERTAHPRRRVLTLASAARANSPDRHLIPAQRYDRLTWFLGYAGAEAPSGYDVVFNAIADADAAAALAGPLAAFMQTCGRCVLNSPERIARTARDAAPRLFGDVPDLVVPAVYKVSRAAELEGLEPQDYLLRPAGAHGGDGLRRLAGEDVARRLDGASHYLMRFHDFASPDGAYRKYRMFFVDRKPYPYHLAIHDDWLVHYQSSLTPSRAAYLDEERRYLEDPRAVLGDIAYEAVAEIGQRLDLDFAGADFAVLPDGRALLFEANATMYVHDEPPDGPLAFKNPFVLKILEAFWARLESA